MKLGPRMKEYESVTKSILMNKTPAILRIDGKAFHTWTKGMKLPFDERMVVLMGHTMKTLVNEIQGAVFAYAQSDEISILLRNYDSVDTESWFGGKIQKMVSVAASIATASFNDHIVRCYPTDGFKLAYFDARISNIPHFEVCNYFIWRQQDAIRNSIRSLGHAVLGHKKIQGVNNTSVMNMMKDRGVDWYDLPPHLQRGYCYQRGQENVDLLIPTFVDIRDYVDIHVCPTIT